MADGYLSPMIANDEKKIAMDDGSWHQMGRRSRYHDYARTGIYHITIRVTEGLGQPLGRVVGDVSKADGDKEAPRVELTDVGKMVAEELAGSITRFYPMIEVQEQVVMPEHLHCLVVVHKAIVSKQGRPTHLGQVIAGFKKGCNRRYWELTGQGGWQSGKPTDALKTAPTAAAEGRPTGTAEGRPTGNTEGAGVRPAVFPQGGKVPSDASSGRLPLFGNGYVDVMPVDERQIETQRAYIRQNPRSRLMRTQNREWLQPRRGGIDTLLTQKALMNYLRTECLPSQFTAETASVLSNRLLMEGPKIGCDSYGNRQLLSKRLLPVVCHRRDKALLARQKEQCMAAARAGAVMVSARIATGEQDIMDAIMAEGLSTVLVMDNGMGEVYHPSGQRLEQCAEGRLLLVSPWRFRYRGVDEDITVAECKAMNCVVQALCRTRDDWWKKSLFC